MAYKKPPVVTIAGGLYMPLIIGGTLAAAQTLMWRGLVRRRRKIAYIRLSNHDPYHILCFNRDAIAAVWCA
jgi:hypothetical protein